MKTLFSCSKTAGIDRTLVAVGTARLDSMLLTTRAAAPFKGSVTAGFGSTDLTSGGARLDSVASIFTEGDFGAEVGAKISTLDSCGRATFSFGV